MVNAAGKFRETELRQDDNCEKPTSISNDGKDDRKAENRNFLPQFALADVHIQRRDHDDRNQRTNPTATLGNIKSLPIAGDRTYGRADVVNGDSKQMAQRSDDADAGKL